MPYNADGSLDTGFGISGKVITPVGTDNDRGQAMAIQPDGKILAAGAASLMKRKGSTLSPRQGCCPRDRPT